MKFYWTKKQAYEAGWKAAMEKASQFISSDMIKKDLSNLVWEREQKAYLKGRLKETHRLIEKFDL